MQADQGSNRQLEHSSEQAKPSHASAPTCHAAVTRLSQVGSASRMAEQAAAALAPPGSALPSAGAAHSAFTACSRSSRVGKANRAEAPAQKGGAASACPSGPSADGSAKNTCRTVQDQVATQVKATCVLPALHPPQACPAAPKQTRAGLPSPPEPGLAERSAVARLPPLPKAGGCSPLHRR